MSGRTDDAAQVVLRALLAWPLLGLTAGLATTVVVEARVQPLAFTLGAGAGAALALTLLEAATTPLRRWPRLAALVALPLAALLSPAALLGGEFARALLTDGTSWAATRSVLAQHADAPLELLDLDVAAGAALALSGLLVGRSLGWRPVVQSAVSAWATLVGLALLLAGGRLVHVPLAIPLAAAVWVAATAPFVVELADRTVRALRERDARGLLARLRPLALGRRHALASAALAVAALLTARGAATTARGLLTGLEARVTLGLALGADPVALREWVDEPTRNPYVGWWEAGIAAPSVPLPAELDRTLSELAADRGHVASCVALTTDLDHHPFGLGTTVRPRVRRWLLSAIEGGSDVAALRLWSVSRDAPEDAQRAGDQVLAAARDPLRRGPFLRGELGEVWRRSPSRRAELEAIFAAAPTAWAYSLLRVVSRNDSPGAGRNPPRSSLAAMVTTLRAELRARPPGMGLDAPAQLFSALLAADPTLALEEDALALTFPGGVPFPPALDVAPLDAGSAPALAAVTRREWSAVWAAGPIDPATLRARAHHMLALRRGGPHRDGLQLLLLAQAHLVAAGPPDDAALAFDRALLLLHEAQARLEDGGQAAPTPLVVALELVAALAPDPAEVEPQVAPLLAHVLATHGRAEPAALAEQRTLAAEVLRTRAQLPDLPAEVSARLRTAADRLEALP